MGWSVMHVGTYRLVHTCVADLGRARFAAVVCLALVLCSGWVGWDCLSGRGGKQPFNFY